MYRLIRLPPRCYNNIPNNHRISTICDVQLNFKVLHHKSKIPKHPVDVSLLVPKSTETIDQKTLKLLEHLSLVNLENDDALQTLENSIQFVQKIFDIDTGGVEPIYAISENQPLILRSDEVLESNKRKDILFNAKVVTEDYFVMPLGNIPLK